MTESVVQAIGSSVVGLLSAWIGAAVVWRSQSRGMVYRERALAAALLADLDRIEQALPPVDVTNHFDGGQLPPNPALHEWIRPCIVELAAADPRIVRHCLSLERLLKNRNDATIALGSAASNQNGAINDATRTRAAIGAPNRAERPGELEQMLETFNTRVELCGQQVVQARTAWGAADRQLSMEIRGLRDVLHPIAKKRLPGLMFALLPQSAQERIGVVVGKVGLRLSRQGVGDAAEPL